MDKKKMVKKLQTAKTVMDFGSSVILNCMAFLFASSIVQPAFSCFNSLTGLSVASPSFFLPPPRHPAPWHEEDLCFPCPW